MEKMTEQDAIRIVSDMFVGLPDDYWPDMEARADEFLFDNGFVDEQQRATIIDKAQ